jgi:hypothetical protein
MGTEVGSINRDSYERRPERRHEGRRDHDDHSREDKHRRHEDRHSREHDKREDRHNRDNDKHDDRQSRDNDRYESRRHKKEESHRPSRFHNVKEEVVEKKPSPPRVQDILNQNIRQDQISYDHKDTNYQLSIPAIKEVKQPSRSYQEVNQPNRSYQEVKQPIQSYQEVKQPVQSYQEVKQPVQLYQEVKQETNYQIPREHHPVGEIEMSGSSHSSMSIAADQTKPQYQPQVETNQKHGIEKNVLTVCSYFYEEGRKAKRKPTTKVFKNNEEVSKSDPQIQDEINELSTLYTSELNKRNQKLKEKLLELSTLNTQIAHTLPSTITSILESFTPTPLSSLPTVPVLYIKPVSNNPKLGQLKTALKKNCDREREIRENLGKKKLDICEIENEIEVMDFKILVSEAKVKA